LEQPQLSASSFLFYSAVHYTNFDVLKPLIKFQVTRDSQRSSKEQKKWFPGKVNRDPELLPLSSELLQILDIFDAAKRNEALKKCEDCK
jgi:hypothetical protein